MIRKFALEGGRVSQVSILRRDIPPTVYPRSVALTP